MSNTSIPKASSIAADDGFEVKRRKIGSWRADVYASCREQEHCANEFGVAWRYQVPTDRRDDKRVGQCLCSIYEESAIVKCGPR